MSNSGFLQNLKGIFHIINQKIEIYNRWKLEIRESSYLGDNKQKMSLA